MKASFQRRSFFFTLSYPFSRLPSSSLTSMGLAILTLGLGLTHGLYLSQVYPFFHSKGSHDLRGQTYRVYQECFQDMSERMRNFEPIWSFSNHLEEICRQTVSKFKFPLGFIISRDVHISAHRSGTSNHCFALIPVNSAENYIMQLLLLCQKRKQDPDTDTKAEAVMNPTQLQHDIRQP